MRTVSRQRALSVLMLGGLLPAGVAHAAAPTGHFTASSGTVLDTKTKLVWQQVHSATTYSWEEAKTYCAGLSSTLGGTGWRVPTIKELHSIFDPRDITSIDAIFAPTTKDFFWSSTPLAGSTDIFGLNFDQFSFTGSRWSSAPTVLHLVRCVR